MKRQILLVLLSLSCLSADCGGGKGETSPCGPDQGTVVSVVDGDTVDLASGVRVRYLLVDTPEVSHTTGTVSDCFGEEARALNTLLVLNQEVNLEYDVECRDRFDRTLAYVSLGDRMVNRILVERGYARVLVIPPNGTKYAEEFRALEASAEQAGAGLWGVCQ